MPTNIGSGYEVQFVDGVLQQRLIGTSLWSTIAVNVTEARHSVGAGLGSIDPSDIGVAWKGPWCYPFDPSSEIVYTSTRTDINFAPVDQYFFEPDEPASSFDSLYLTYSVEIPHVITATAPAPSAPVSTIETTLSMSGHQIVDGLPATMPSGFVVLSQLTALSQALTTVINAGDAVNATQIANLAQVVATLPAGLTMPTVQSAIDAAVANAVFNEALDDAQKQAIVDAALAQLSTIDTAVIGRVGAAEALIASLEPRVAALETLTTNHTAQIAAGVAKDAAQDAAIGAAAAAAQSAILTNNAQNERINQSELGISMLNQIATPIEVKIVNGAVTEVIGCAMNMITIDNSNDRHMQVSINLGTDNNGQRRVLQGFRLMPNGTERDLGGAYSRNGEIYIAAFLKTCDGSSSVNFVLN